MRRGSEGVPYLDPTANQRERKGYNCFMDRRKRRLVTDNLRLNTNAARDNTRQATFQPNPTCSYRQRSFPCNRRYTTPNRGLQEDQQGATVRTYSNPNYEIPLRKQRNTYVKNFAYNPRHQHHHRPYANSFKVNRLFVFQNSAGKSDMKPEGSTSGSPMVFNSKKLHFGLREKNESGQCQQCSTVRGTQQMQNCNRPLKYADETDSDEIYSDSEVTLKCEDCGVEQEVETKEAVVQPTALSCTRKSSRLSNESTEECKTSATKLISTAQHLTVTDPTGTPVSPNCQSFQQFVVSTASDEVQFRDDPTSAIKLPDSGSSGTTSIACPEEDLDKPNSIQPLKTESDIIQMETEVEVNECGTDWIVVPFGDVDGEDMEEYVMLNGTSTD